MSWEIQPVTAAPVAGGLVSEGDHSDPPLECMMHRMGGGSPVLGPPCKRRCSIHPWATATVAQKK